MYFYIYFLFGEGGWRLKRNLYYLSVSLQVKAIAPYFLISLAREVSYLFLHPCFCVCLVLLLYFYSPNVWCNRKHDALIIMLSRGCPEVVEVEVIFLQKPLFIQRHDIRPK